MDGRRHRAADGSGPLRDARSSVDESGGVEENSAHQLSTDSAAISPAL